MSKAVIEKRVQELLKAVEQSAANHNMLVGHLNEAKHLLTEIVKEELNAEIVPAEDSAYVPLEEVVE